MNGKRKTPEIDDHKENEQTKPTKKVHTTQNLFNFFSKKPKNSKKSIKAKEKPIKPKSQINGKKSQTPTKSKPQTLTEYLKDESEIGSSRKTIHQNIPNESECSPEPDLKNFRSLELPSFLKDREASYKLVNLSDQIAENPEKSPLSKCFWSTGVFSQAFPYFLVSETLEAVARQSGENSVQNKRRMLANLLLEAIKQSPSELFVLYNFLTCRFDADFRQKDILIGNETILKLVGKLSGKTLKHMREGLKKVGDLGSLAEMSRADQKTISTFFVPVKTKDLNMKVTLYDCFKTLQKLADIRKCLFRGNF